MGGRTNGHHSPTAKFLDVENPTDQVGWLCRLHLAHGPEVEHPNLNKTDYKCGLMRIKNPMGTMGFLVTWHWLKPLRICMVVGGVLSALENLGAGSRGKQPVLKWSGEFWSWVTARKVFIFLLFHAPFAPPSHSLSPTPSLQAGWKKNLWHFNHFDKLYLFYFWIIIKVLTFTWLIF